MTIDAASTRRRVERSVACVGTGMHRSAYTRAPMDVEITARAGYLAVSVSERAGADDSRELLHKLIGVVQAGEHRRVLISVRRSRALFKVEE